MRMQHYAIFLQGFSFEIKYKNTKPHSNADCLSRLPVTTTTTAEHDVVDIYEIEILHEISVSADKSMRYSRGCAIEKSSHGHMRKERSTDTNAVQYKRSSLQRTTRNISV